eukprot:TRINITY_DN339_c0_g1_i8.p1 TRINITY_DN339_c0_g1~~TRINITY_DN339_c0_g1_i8.p1  ORF type:complete len:266 (+),score=20.75 TRINITY_DN339_c0_g1_i8:385-1182(+)
MYIALVSSKIAYGLLLKTERSYLQMLESFQATAMRICCSALRGTPRGAMQTLLDLPPVSTLIRATGLRLFVGTFNADMSEFSNFVADDGVQEAFYNASPFAWFTYACQETSENLQQAHARHQPRLPDLVAELEGLMMVDADDCCLFDVCYALRCLNRPCRDSWTPQQPHDDETTLFSDGGFRKSDKMGAAAASSPTSDASLKFWPCVSSTHAEYEGMALATELAMEMNPHRKESLCFCDRLSCNNNRDRRMVPSQHHACTASNST